MSEVELPDGRNISSNSRTLNELKEEVSRLFPGDVSADDFAFVDPEGTPLSKQNPIPKRVKTVPKPIFGASIRERILYEDLLELRNHEDYGNKFQVHLLSQSTPNPMRVYFTSTTGKWATIIQFDTYPIRSNPDVLFDQRIPPCPKHSFSFHPNIYDDGYLCWGEVNLLSGTRLVGIFNTILTLLNSPYHRGQVPFRCLLIPRLGASGE